jgi:hypothetical protein
VRSARAKTHPHKEVGSFHRFRQTSGFSMRAQRAC